MWARVSSHGSHSTFRARAGPGPSHAWGRRGGVARGGRVTFVYLYVFISHYTLSLHTLTAHLTTHLSTTHLSLHTSRRPKPPLTYTVHLSCSMPPLGYMYADGETRGHAADHVCSSPPRMLHACGHAETISSQSCGSRDPHSCGHGLEVPLRRRDRVGFDVEQLLQSLEIVRGGVLRDCPWR